MTDRTRDAVLLTVDGVEVEVADADQTLLSVLREQLGVTSVKDGCSPQGQCGCCTVWVDGAPRVSCVTPVRRVAGRSVTTLCGLDAAVRDRWVRALVATGGSQCGFCTPGIVLRLAALAVSGTSSGTSSSEDRRHLGARVDQSLAAHLCRCTGWQTVREAALAVLLDEPLPDPAARDLDRAGGRATLEGRSVQRVGPEVAAGRAPFADDGAPAGALVAVPVDPSVTAETASPATVVVSGGPAGAVPYVVAPTLAEARRRAGKVQGRNSTVGLRHPIRPPEGGSGGAWSVTLATTWVEPAYVEPDASWCAPGGEPCSSRANGGAFGGKACGAAETAARELAERTGSTVRVVWSREDVVRLGPKRPPVAGAARPDGTGVLRVGAPEAGGWLEEEWADVVTAVAAIAPGLALEAVPVPGPPLARSLRAAVWAEAAVLDRCARAGVPVGVPTTGVPVAVQAPDGGRAVVTVGADGSLDVEVDGGRSLDEVVLRSYAVGAVHQALGWVRSEGVAVDEGGVVRDLTVRSFGIVPARAMPSVSVRVTDGGGRGPVNASDAVFAAAAAAFWLADGLPPAWPTRR
jgi:xanthine dehydrogenase small subunit